MTQNHDKQDSISERTGTNRPPSQPGKLIKEGKNPPPDSKRPTPTPAPPKDKK